MIAAWTCYGFPHSAVVLAESTMADKLEDVGFEELAREFQQVLSNISQVGDKSLDRFREEYEKIYVALRKVRCRSSSGGTTGAAITLAFRAVA